MGRNKHQNRPGFADLLTRRNVGAPQKPPKRAAVWMDTSDNENDAPTKSPKSPTAKGAHKVHNQAKKVKMHHHHKATKESSSLEEQRKQLPIAEGSFSCRSACYPVIYISPYRNAGRASLIEEVQANDVTVVVGETGSGKTTRASLRSQ